MAELYQTKDTTTVHIKIKVFVIKMSFFIESLVSKEESVFQKRMIGKLLKGFQ